MAESEGLLVVGEGDRVVKVSLKEFPDSGRLMTWDLVKPDGSHDSQTFWAWWENRSMLNLNAELVEGQFVRSIAIAEGGIRITFNSEMTIQFPLLFGS